jgi:hypothetical protein
VAELSPFLRTGPYIRLSRKNLSGKLHLGRAVARIGFFLRLGKAFLWSCQKLRGLHCITLGNPRAFPICKANTSLCNLILFLSLKHNNAPTPSDFVSTFRFVYRFPKRRLGRKRRTKCPHDMRMKPIARGQSWRTKDLSMINQNSPSACNIRNVLVSLKAP